MNNISTQGLTGIEFFDFNFFLNNNLNEIRDIEKDEKIDIDVFNNEEEIKIIIVKKSKKVRLLVLIFLLKMIIIIKIKIK